MLGQCLEPEPSWLCVPDTGLKIWWERLLRVMRPGDPEPTTEVLVSGLSICHGFFFRNAASSGGWGLSWPGLLSSFTFSLFQMFHQMS